MYFLEIENEYDIEELKEKKKEINEAVKEINNLILQQEKFFNRLNPCPVCKGSNLIIPSKIIETRQHHAIECNDCHITTRYFNSGTFDIKELADEWNNLKKKKKRNK